MESFNGRLRQGYLKENWFISLEDARCKIEARCIHYNQRRHHSSLGWKALPKFVQEFAGGPDR
ncbi:integrase core domain-containing protein [Citrobacter portucalensis]|uniref:integrase core domain-containing protein n=1 Tax=Citrobacter portucalensis TaxID=1639133 RepID=UPI003D78A988